MVVLTAPLSPFTCGEGPRSGKFALILWKRESDRFLYSKKTESCNVALCAVHTLGLERVVHFPDALELGVWRRVLSVLEGAVGEIILGNKEA